MLIKESHLRAIIREELIREHQELMLENFLQNLSKKGKTIIPAMAVFLSANLMSGCDQINDMLDSAGPAPISNELTDSQKLGLEARPAPGMDVSMTGVDNIGKYNARIEESIKQANETIKELESRNFKDPKQKEAFIEQLKNCIKVLKVLKDEANDKAEEGLNFADIDFKAQIALVGKQEGTVKMLADMIGWERPLSGGYFLGSKK